MPGCLEFGYVFLECTEDWKIKPATDPGDSVPRKRHGNTTGVMDIHEYPSTIDTPLIVRLLINCSK